MVDELWTFIGGKAQQAWVWIVLSRRTLQVVAFFVGKRDLQSAHAVWEQVPSPWRDGLVFTDGLRVYEALFQETPLKHCPGVVSGSATERFGFAGRAYSGCGHLCLDESMGAGAATSVLGARRRVRATAMGKPRRSGRPVFPVRHRFEGMPWRVFDPFSNRCLDSICAAFLPAQSRRKCSRTSAFFRRDSTT